MRGGGTVYVVLAAYFLVNAGLRLAQPASLELDEGQQLFLAQWLAIGYDTQPPLYNWLQYGMVQLLGNTVLALTLLKNLMLFACYALVGWAASQVIRNRALVVIAMLGLLTIPQIVFESQRDLTHSVALLFSACLFIAALFSALKTGRFLAYLLTGVAIGLGIISKYNFLLLPLAAFVAILLEPEFRRRLLDWRILFTALVAAAIAAPHAYWFYFNMELATGRTLGKLTEGAGTDRTDQIITGLFSYGAAIVGFSALTIVAFWLSFGRRFHQSWQASSPWSRLVGRMMLIILAAVLLLVLVGGVSLVKERWLTPFLFMLPLWLALKLDALDVTIGNAPNRFAAIAVTLLVAVPIVLFVRVPAAQYLGKYQKQNVPYGPAIEAILASGQHRPSLILTADQQMAGNLRLNAPDIAVIAPGYERFKEDLAFDATHPLLLVWRGKGEANAPIPETLQRLLASQVEAGAVVPVPQDVARPYHYGRPGDVYHFQYAWIYPPSGE